MACLSGSPSSRLGNSTLHRYDGMFKSRGVVGLAGAILGQYAGPLQMDLGTLYLAKPPCR